MPTPSQQLLSLARELLDPYARLPGVACVAITGSSTEGLSDNFSDVDSTVYYDTFPPEAEIRAVRAKHGVKDLLWSIGSYEAGEFCESYRLKGVECQIGHTTVACWERDMNRTLAGEEPGSPLHKAMSGTLISIPIFGADRLEAWQKQIRAYPDALRLAMVRHHLKFFAVWGVIDRLEVRDAHLWIRQALLDSSFNILGTLAGLNREFFTPFQFKRTRAFIAKLKLAPPDLADRLELLWTLPPRAAVSELRSLAVETTELVEQNMPEIDTAAARKALARNDGAWTLPAIV